MRTETNRIIGEAHPLNQAGLSPEAYHSGETAKYLRGSEVVLGLSMSAARIHMVTYEQGKCLHKQNAGYRYLNTLEYPNGRGSRFKPDSVRVRISLLVPAGVTEWHTC